MISFSAEQSSTMPAHLSIIQHLLFHLFKLAGKKKKKSLQLTVEGFGSRRQRVNQFCSEAQPFTLSLFLYTCQEHHDIRSALTKLQRWRPELHRPQLRCNTVSRKSHSTTMRGREKRRGIDSVFCTVAHRRRIVTTPGRRWLQLYPTSLAQFIGGIFTYNWGSFHLACQQA